LTDANNLALVHDYAGEKQNCYLLDITFDKQQKPAILVIASKGFEAGPVNAPRKWTLFRWKQNKWEPRVVTTSDSNYDMGSVYVESNRKLKVIGPTVDGPQAYNPGGEVAMWGSDDGGDTWTMEKQMTQNSPMNHSYVRKPVNARFDFYGIWADGHGRKPSESYLYFTDSKGVVYRLPRHSSEAMITPEIYK
jgi:hypothetical protein